MRTLEGKFDCLRDFAQAETNCNVRPLPSAAAVTLPALAPTGQREAPDDEELSLVSRSNEQKEADAFKQKGNELYKRKQFKEALEMYDEAIEREPNEIVYVNNKCAVWVEMGSERYDQALAALQDVVDRRYEIDSANPSGASCAKVANVFSRMASIYEKKKKYGKAIEMHNKSLAEDDNGVTRTALRELELARNKRLCERAGAMAVMFAEKEVTDLEEDEYEAWLEEQQLREFEEEFA